MKKQFIVSCICVLIAAGCGGGGVSMEPLALLPTDAAPTGSEDAQGQTARTRLPSTIVLTPPLAPTGSETGPSTLTAFKMPGNFLLNVALDVPFRENTAAFDAVMMSSNKQAASDMIEASFLVNDSDPSLTYSEVTNNGVNYRFKVHGPLSDGGNFAASVGGARLLREGIPTGQYVSYNTFVSPDGVVYATDGSSPSGMTPVAATYTGTSAFVHWVEGKSSGIGGTFQMSVDFGSGNASLSAIAENAVMTATASGVSDIFSPIEGTGTITHAGKVSVPANLLGYFAGEDGLGVHGSIVEEESAASSWVAVSFAGNKN